MGVIRLLLAISVVVFHAGQSAFGLKFIGGSLAVQLFFIISGFYMALILNEKYMKENSTYLLFISNRLLRLYPLYFAVFIITLLTFMIDYFFLGYTNNWLGYCIQYGNSLNASTIFYVILSNLLIIGQDIALFLGVNPLTGGLIFTQNFKDTALQLNNFMVLGQAWTVGLEIMFYLVAPFLVRNQIKVIFILILLSILLRAFIYYVLHMKYDPWTYRFFPTEMVYFLSGCAAYNAYKFLSKLDLRRNHLIVIWFILCLFTIFYGNIFSILNGIHMYQTIFHIFYIAFFIGTFPFVFILTKKIKIDSQIGELSYPIYLSHSLFLYLDKRLEIGSVLFVVFSTILFSLLLNYLIANPIEIIRQKRVILLKDGVVM